MAPNTSEFPENSVTESNFEAAVMCSLAAIMISLGVGWLGGASSPMKAFGVSTEASVDGKQGAELRPLVEVSIPVIADPSNRIAQKGSGQRRPDRSV